MKLMMIDFLVVSLSNVQYLVYSRCTCCYSLIYSFDEFIYKSGKREKCVYENGKEISSEVI